jgi:hypothetical protein
VTRPSPAVSLGPRIEAASSLGSGSYYLVAVVDDAESVTATDEFDNTFISAIPQVQVKRTDLAVTTLTLPANLGPGSYFLSAVVDGGGAAAESVETNNGLTAAGQIVVSGATAATAPH